MKGKIKMLFSLLVATFLPVSGVFGKDARTIHLDEKQVAPIVVSSRGTVLSFPIKPTKVILGRAESFGIEYIDNDLAISPLSSTAHSNLFVYISGRRFSFDLTTSMNEGSSVILVRDQLSASRVSWISSAPSGSPWALAVLARFGEPLPICVLQTISVGLSLPFLAFSP